MKFESSRMTKDDVLFGYRPQVFDLAGRTNVSHARRVFGIHRSTYYAWKAQVDRGGLGMLRPRERRAPQMPNQLSAVVEERIVSFAIAHPGLGPKRIAAELARDKWGALVVSPNGAYKVLRRHGLNTRKPRPVARGRPPGALRAAPGAGSRAAHRRRVAGHGGARNLNQRLRGRRRYPSPPHV
jgi:transposase